MKQKYFIKLKPSSLIRVALKDLRKVEKDKAYKVDMGTWHSQTYDGHMIPVCAVCFAGSVLAKSLGKDPEESIDIGNLSGPVAKRMLALNNFRCGAVPDGLTLLGIPNGFKNRYVPRYGFNRTGFYNAMNRLARDLTKAGL